VLVVMNQTPGLLDRYGFTRADADRDALAVDAAGRRFRGAAAANRALLALGPPWSTLGRLYWVRPVGRLEDRAYRWVERNRAWLSKLTRTAPELPD
jgi:predicted DCC family thiol-disulfide oxidoreductase YuxK